MHQEALQQRLTESIVTQDAALLGYVNAATFKTHAASQLVVRTQSISDIILLLEYCTAHHLKLYVVSCGKNWGFGSMAPVRDVTVLLDLSPMNRIISYDPEFGTVRCEPGVTFRQLADFLQQQGNRHFLNTIGGDPDSSVLGNILERGDGVGPYCERSEYACAPEILLANGELLDAGAISDFSDLSKTGVGPGFQEIFFQSNLAIVTKMTLWLSPVPATFRSFHFSLAEAHGLAAVLDRLKALYDRRVLNTPIAFWNDYKQLVNVIQYPWSLQPVPPLHRATIKSMSNNYSAWYAFGGIYTDHPKIAGLTVQEIFESLRGLIRKNNFLSTFSTAKIKYLKALYPLLKKWGIHLDAIFQSWEKNGLLGHLPANSTKSLFWRKKKQIPNRIDPQEQRCGLHWNAFLLPFNGAVIAKALEEIDQLILKHGFEPVVSLVVLNNRYVRVYQQLIFDREVEGEDANALQCHRAIFDYILQAGYTHTRLDILTMEARDKLVKSLTLYQKIKEALDPDHLISPGRYFMD